MNKLKLIGVSIMLAMFLAAIAVLTTGTLLTPEENEECNKICENYEGCKQVTECDECLTKLVEMTCKDGTTFFKTK